MNFFEFQWIFFSAFAQDMARGKDQKGGTVKNVQAYERLSFLHQAAILMSTIQYDTKASTPSKPSATASTPKHKVKDWQGDPPGTLHATSRHLNNHMKQITGKLVMRLYVDHEGNCVYLHTKQSD